MRTTYEDTERKNADHEPSSRSQRPNSAANGRVRSTAHHSNGADGSNCATRSFTPSPRRVRPVADGTDIRCVMFRDRKLFFSDSDPCRNLTNTGLQAGVTPNGTRQPFQPEPSVVKAGQLQNTVPVMRMSNLMARVM